MKYYAPITDYIVRSTYIRSLYFPVLEGSTWSYQHHAYIVSGSLDECSFGFMIPNECKDIVECYFTYIPLVTPRQMQIGLDIYFSQDGEHNATHSYSSNTFTFTSGGQYCRCWQVLPDMIKNNGVANDAGIVRFLITLAV